tara:strand:- start:1959 stop:2378 length:420 start_codon:yes stop_codon:yes gene_type:complete
MAEKKEKLTKETAPRGPGIYVEDDGSITDIRSDGKVIKNAKARYQETPFSYKTHIKPTIDFINNVGEDLGYAAVGATALPRVLFQQVGNFISDFNYKQQILKDTSEMVWSEKHNKYMSKYDLKIQKTIDAGLEAENSGG